LLKVPSHITSTDLRLDMVWKDDDAKTVTMLGLTVPYDTWMKEAVECETCKYIDLQESTVSAGT